MTLLQRPAELRLQVARRRTELEAANRTLHAEVEERDRVERALRWSEARLRQFIEYAGAAIFLHDTHGQLLNVNREACQLLGYSQAELLALPLARIAMNFRLEAQQQARAALLPGTAVTFDDRLRRVGREPCPVTLKVAAFDCGGRRLYVTFARDISERLIAEDALARTRDELEVRVSQRVAALEEANERLVREIAERREVEAALRTALEVAEEADATKSRFLANLSHEIRAPMNGLLGMLNLLRDHPLSAEQRDYVATAMHSGASLLQLLDDLLDLSRIEAGQMVLDPVETELRPWLEAQLGGPRARAVARAVAFTCAVDPALPAWARFDATRLGQVLYNLLDNSIKFTPDGGTVELRLEQTAAAGSVALRVVVRDTGIGIPQEAIERIFDAFVQVEETLTRRHGGPGLGLAISSRLVGLMGGRVEVQSTVGAGSTFTFTVPLEACAAPAEPAPGDRPDGHGVATVLVAEDDHTSQQVALAMLRRLGCRTVLAVDGRAAVTALTAGAFDLVLMDCHLPEMDGFSATAAIRRREQATGQRVPILGVTGDVDPAAVAACRDAGMDGHLGKPLQLAMLREVLVRWVPHWHPPDGTMGRRPG
jgi:PAS domain S-box-containing protein